MKERIARLAIHAGAAFGIHRQVQAFGGRGGRLQRIAVAFDRIEVVLLLSSSRLECASIKAKMVVFLVGISLLLLRDSASDLIGVANIDEGLVVGPLEVVIDLAAMFLLTKSEVLALQLCSEIQILLMLRCQCALVLLSLNPKLLLSLRR